MNAQELDHFKTRLEQLRDDLRADSDTANEDTKPVQLDQSSVGRLSRMDALQVQAMAVETRRRRELQWRRIDLALARIEFGEYGICQSCEEDIDPRRLEIDPASLQCIGCASARELS